MKELSDATICVVDHGLFFCLAERLARDAKRVLYHTPWESGFPLLNDAAIGDGFDEVERCNDFWPLKDEINLFVFPDLFHSGLQLELESQGKRVWGSRTGDTLEILREKFRKIQAKQGMDVPEYVVVNGLKALRKHLEPLQDKYIKISKWRGSCDTWHHINYELSCGILDDLAVRFGPLQDKVPFIVEDAIPTDIELGCDSFCVDGQFPKTIIHGYEAKDVGFLASVQSWDDAPDAFKETSAALAPVLKQHRYRNQFSSEIRVSGNYNYLIDPCTRCPSPALESQLEMMTNIGEVIWHGSTGEMVEPEFGFKFGVEVTIEHKGDKAQWRSIQVPNKIKQWVKLMYPVKVGDETYATPPLPFSGTPVGAIVGVGDTIEDAINHMKENVSELGDNPVDIDISSLVELLKEVHIAEKEGIEFTDQRVPEPTSVLETNGD